MFRTVPGTSTDLGGVKVTTNFTRPEPSDSPVPRETSYAPPELLCLKVCMFVCVHVCACACACACARACACACVRACVCAYLRLRLSVCACVYVMCA